MQKMSIEICLFEPCLCYMFLDFKAFTEAAWVNSLLCTARISIVNNLVSNPLNTRPHSPQPCVCQCGRAESELSCMRWHGVTTLVTFLVRRTDADLRHLAIMSRYVVMCVCVCVSAIECGIIYLYADVLLSEFELHLISSPPTAFTSEVYSK